MNGFFSDIPYNGRLFMTIFNFGSINIDHVYQVEHFVRPGETMTSNQYTKVLGGKGANQSIALAQAQANVMHVGAIDVADQGLLKQLSEAGVNTSHIAQLEQPTGHAIIQVNNEAENAIVLFAGANHALTDSQIHRVLDTARPNDWVLLQNETNNIGDIISAAKARGLSVAFNPAPMDKTLVLSVIEQVDVLIVNEVEAMDLCDVDSIELAQAALQNQFNQLTTIMTLGAQGVRHISQEGVVEVGAFSVDAVDTTAAGDTFIGFCLAGFMSDLSVKDSLQRACAASAICVTKAGASVAIPSLAQVEQFLENHHLGN